MFFGRKAQLAILDNFYTDENSRIACIYGRAGMGKTALVKEFAKDKRHTYFSAYATTGIRETELFARACGYKKKLASPVAGEQLTQILADLQERIELEGEPHLLIIDNYPYFAKAEADFEQTLSFFVDRVPLVKLIFCGDSYLSMGKLFWDKKALWKDKLDLCFELLPLGFYEAMEFLPDVADSMDKACIYGICGGIPYHLKRAGSDVASSISNVFFANKECSLLPERTLQTELRELSYYNHILTTLACGMNRVNQISKAVDKPKDVVVPYMNTMMSIGVVTKENPVTEKTNRKKTRYSIVNTFDEFWYRFLAPFVDLYQEDTDALMEQTIAPGLPGFIERVFVSICREYLERRSAKGDLPFSIREIGNWWQNDDEKQTTEGFDLVAVGDMAEEEAIIFARCYSSDEPVGIAELKGLIDLTKQVKGKKNVFYLVFSKSGFHENTTTVAATIKNIILVSLEEIING